MNSRIAQRVFLPLLLVGIASAFGWPDRDADRPTFHTQLESSTPAEGDTLHAPLETIVLTFNNPVQVGLSSVVIDLASGDSVVLVLRQDPIDELTILADARALTAGPARLRWTTAAADGHKVNGSFQFVVSAAAARAWMPAPADTSAAAEAAEPAGAVDAAAATDAPVEWSQETEPGGRRLVPILVSGAGSLFLLTLAGLLFFVATAQEPESTDATLQALSIRAALFLAALAASMLMIEVIVWARDLSAGGADGMFAALNTATGRAGLGRAVLAFAALVAVQTTRGRGVVAVMLAFLAVLAGSAGGHPASFSPAISMPANAIHQVAAALWAGGLVYLVLACGGAEEETRPTSVSAVRRVSSLALVALIAVSATGFLQSWLFLPDFGAFTATRYGQLAIAKAVGLLVLAAFGAYHRFRLIPALTTAGGEAALGRSVRREMWIMGIVVFIAAFLSHASPEVG